MDNKHALRKCTPPHIKTHLQVIFRWWEEIQAERERETEGVRAGVGTEGGGGREKERERINSHNWNTRGQARGVGLCPVLST